MDHYWPRRPIPIRCRQHRERMASAWDVIEPIVSRKLGYIVSPVFFWMAKKKIMTGQGLPHQLDDFPLVGDRECFDELSERILRVDNDRRQRIFQIIKP